MPTPEVIVNRKDGRKTSRPKGYFKVKSSNPPTKPSKEDTVTEAEIASALLKNCGLQYLTAFDVGLSEVSICKRIQRSEYLQEIKKVAKEKNKDLAERNIIRVISDDNPDDPTLQVRTSFKYLDRVGKDRGYGEHIKHEIPELPISITVSPASPEEGESNAKKLEK